jgi:chromate transporter
MTKKQTQTPSLFFLSKAAFYIGATGYGGPAVVAHMKKILVQKKHWLSDDDFMDALSIAQVLPGATGVSIMAYIGNRLAGLWGAIVMPAVFVTPAFILVVVLAQLYFTYSNIGFVKSIMAGLGALVIALLINATVQIGKSVFKKGDPKVYRGLSIAAIAFVLSYILHFDVIYIILLSGSAGFLLFYFDTVLPSHVERVAARVSTPRSSKDMRKKVIYPLFFLVVACALVFLAPLARQIGTTFFIIGSFAFGGGITSIPLIQHQVVDQLGWVTLSQFRDGIAIGQITPGPIFITATFIGYRVFGLLGALAATVAVFLPSLILITAISRVQANIKNMKSYRTITKGFLAGFIGILVATTLRFGYAALISWQAWAIFGVSLVWLLYLKKDPIWPILVTIIVSLFIFAV